MNLSFSGCGFLGIYHVGVASCFREYAPHVLVDKIAGASFGSLAACALICDISLGETTTSVLRVAIKARSRTLGPLHPGFDLNQCIYEGLQNALPYNAHHLCNGRLYISVTRFSDGKNVLLSQFDSKDDLIQALLCSCFIPLYSGFMPPKFHGVAYFDGGASDNLPVLDDNTVTVSPFSGESDICPQDDSFNILQINLANTSITISPSNLYRCAKTLFPPDPEVLSKMCQQGFDDALKFLQRNNQISCTRCLAVQSSIVVAESESLTETETEESTNSDSDLEHTYDDCTDCRYRRQMALLDSLPESVVKAIEDACDQVNKGALNWLFRHRPVKLLSLLTLPYVLPVDVTIVVFCKIWQLMPTLQKELQSRLQSVLTLIKNLLNKFNNKRHLYSAKFSCQLAITEFDYTEESVSSSYSTPAPGSPPHTTCKLTTEKEVPAEINLPEIRSTLKPNDQIRQQRKSYAGCVHVQHPEPLRRKSMVEMSTPERVIKNMKFGFTMDLTPSIPLNKNKKQNVMTALQSIGEESSDLNAIELTNKALNWERECIGRYHGDIEPQNAEAFGKILDVTSSNEALMAFYYMDENKTVKVTEIYNITDADTSAVLSQEERDVNSHLQWETEWSTDLSSSPPKDQHSMLDQKSCLGNSSFDITETFDDKEFELSDAESCGSEKNDFFLDLKRSELNDNNETFQTNVPRRKTSFIIVNK